MDKQCNITVISGGSRGLGKTLVEQRLAAGDTVATFSRSKSAFIETLENHPEYQQRFIWQSVDCNDAKAVNAFASGVLRKFGRIDVLINNSGIAVEGLLTFTSLPDIHRCIAVNLEATLVLTRACLKGMLHSKSGCVINISSINAIKGHKGLSVYSATKSALDGMTRSLAREVGSQGIRVNSIAPGFFESDMVEDLSEDQLATIVRRTPLKRLCTSEDVSLTADFLIASKAISGQIIAVDGGFTC